MQINIDPVKPSEVELLSNISTHCFYDTFHEKNTKENMKLFLDKSFNMDVLTQELQNSNNYFFFARMRDEVVGYIKMSDLETPPELNNVAAIEIARLYVIKEKIGRGIGKELMDFAFSFARRINRKTVWLGVWELNERAISFYKKLGFQKFGEHVFMVGEDAQTDWLMVNKLEK